VVSWSTAGVQGDLAADSREAELAFAFALGVGRRCAVLLFGESPSHRESSVANSTVGAHEVLAARNVEVDTERELLNPLGYGEYRDSERDAWVGLLAQVGRGLSGRSWPAGRDMLRGRTGNLCEETARRSPSFDECEGAHR